MDSDKLHVGLSDISLEISGKHILNNVSLDLTGGMIYLLFGKSGSGKTSILNVLNTLYRPTSGEYEYNETKVDWSDENCLDNLRKRIGYFHQELALIEDLSLEENLQLISEQRNEAIDSEKLRDYLKLLGINELYRSNISILSGGERQRCAFVKLLIFGYELVLIDEPTNNLDEDNVSFIIEAVTELKLQTKCVVIVSHSKQFFDIADTIFYMEEINEP